MFQYPAAVGVEVNNYKVQTQSISRGCKDTSEVDSLFLLMGKL